jgi:competence protein ComEC
MNKNRKFLLIALSFVFGIFAFGFIKVDNWILFSLSALLASLIFLMDSVQARIVSVCFLFFIFGLLRIGLATNEEKIAPALKNLQDETLSLRGKIAEMPEVKNGKQRIVIEIREDNVPDIKVLVYVSSFQTFSFGDEIRFKGKLKIPENFDGFEYKEYLFSKGIYLISYYPEITLEKSGEKTWGARINNFRKTASENFARILPEPHAGILSATIFGLNSAVSEDILEAFNKTGTRHIIAVSGSHMVVLVAIMIFVFLSAGIHRKRIFYITSWGIFLFIIVSGMSSSAIRAGIMAFTILFAYKIGRLNKSFSALVLAGALMLLINPKLLADDLGFQLSFLATFGIIFFFPYLKKKFVKFPELVGIKNIFLVTLSAQIAILPVLLTNFDGFSVFSFLANIMILPLTPALMIGGFILFFISFINLQLAGIFAFPIYLILSYQLAVVNFFANIDFGYIKF